MRTNGCYPLDINQIINVDVIYKYILKLFCEGGGQLFFVKQNMSMFGKKDFISNIFVKADFFIFLGKSKCRPIFPVRPSLSVSPGN